MIENHLVGLLTPVYVSLNGGYCVLTSVCCSDLRAYLLRARMRDCIYILISFIIYIHVSIVFLHLFCGGVSVLDCSIRQSRGHEITVVLITLGNGNDPFTGQALSYGWGSAGVTWHVGEDFATE